MRSPAAAREMGKDATEVITEFADERRPPVCRQRPGCREVSGQSSRTVPPCRARISNWQPRSRFPAEAATTPTQREVGFPWDADRGGLAFRFLISCVRSVCMKPRHALTLTHSAHCGARIVPTPRELKQWRKAAGLTQRKIAALLKITAAHVNYLENGNRSPGGALISRYWKFNAAAITPHTSAFALTERQRQVTELRSAGLTYATIGRQLGISGERVRQIEMRLLRRVRLN